MESDELMIKVRKSAFETNSSSVHAIVVSENPPDNTYCSVFFGINRFGWEMNVLDQEDERADYFYTAACELFEHDIADELRDRLELLGINCIFSNPPEFEEYDWYGEKCQYLKDGGIDHVDGCKEFVDYLWNDTDALVNFLLNDESFVVTGNDNCDYADDRWREAKVAKADNYPHKVFWKGN